MVDNNINQTIKKEHTMTNTKTTKTATETKASGLFVKNKTGAMIANVSKTQAKAIKDLTNVSAKIRYMAAQGFSTKENMYSAIANYLGKRTQHVRNVLTQPLKKTS